MIRVVIAFVAALFASVAQAQFLQAPASGTTDQCVKLSTDRFHTTASACITGSAPIDAPYYLNAANATLTAEVVPSANVVTLLATASYAAFIAQLDSDLTTWAGITPSANVQTLLGSADNAAMRTNLGLAIGTNVQAFDADLTTYAGITPSANAQTLLGHTFVQMLADIAAQAADADLTSWAAITRGSGFDTFVTTASMANLGALLTDEAAGTITFLTTPSSANLRATLTDESGTGVAYFQGGDLGTPSAGVLTSATGLPIASGVSGLGAGVATFLATPSTANFAAALTGETGSGAAVFATSPALVTPDLGTPSAGVLTSVTGLPISTGVSGLGTSVAAFLATPSSANLNTALTDDVPTLAGSNSFTGITQTVTSTDAAAGAEPSLSLDRNSASPAAADLIGAVLFIGRDSAAASTTYGRLTTMIDDPVDGSEDSHIAARTYVAGTQVSGISPNMMTGSTTYDPPSLNTATGTTTTVSVTGARLGDPAVGSFSLSLAGIMVSYAITSTGTCTASLFNATGGTLDIASGTILCGVLK